MDVSSVVERARRQGQPKKPLNFSAPENVVIDFKNKCTQGGALPAVVLNILIYDFTYSEKPFMLDPNITATRMTILGEPTDD